MKAGKLRKIILALGLSAALAVDSLAGMSAVYAEEIAELGDNASVQETATEPDGEADAKAEAAVETAEETAVDSDEETVGETVVDSDEETTGETVVDSDEETTGETAEDADVETAEETETTEPATAYAEGDDLGQVADDPDAENEDESLSVENEDGANAETNEDLNGFSPMADGYELTDEQWDMKEALFDTMVSLSRSAEGVEYAEGEVVTLADNAEEAEMIAEAYHAEIADYDMGVLTLELDEDQSVASAVETAADLDNNLPAVWPNYYHDQSVEDEIELETYEQVIEELSVSIDPYLQTSSNSYYNQWFHATIGSDAAWNVGYSGSGVRVAVLDTGIASNHPDLQGQIVGSRSFCTGSGSNMDTDSTTPLDDHATHVAGIIAAKANGAYGEGVAPNAKIYDAQVFWSTTDEDGSVVSVSNDATIAKAILYVIGAAGSDIDKAVDVINMSLGGSAYNGVLQDALDQAYQKGVVVFAAAGNSGTEDYLYPASCDHVISVAATDSGNYKTDFTNYNNKVDLSAPGDLILSTAVPTDSQPAKYVRMSGTSMACPVAAGEAAVILSAKSALSLTNLSGPALVDAVEKIMKNNTIAVSGSSSGMGSGITSLSKVFANIKASSGTNQTSGGSASGGSSSGSSSSGSSSSGSTSGSVSSDTGTSTGTPAANSTITDTNPVTTITVAKKTTKSGTITKDNPNPTIDLSSAITVTTKNKTKINGKSLGSSVTWTSSKPSVATVDAYGKVTLLSKGTATITVKSTDKKHKKTTIKITVKQAVMGIVITTSKGESGTVSLAAGKSLTLKAALTPAKPSNKKLKWQLCDSKGNAIDSKTAKRLKISVNKNTGKVTTKKGATAGTYTVKATAADGGGAEESITVEVQ